MAAPTPTARITPTGRFLGDGHQTLVTFSLDPDILLWEKSITPPGLEADDLNDTTNMHNVQYRTKSPRALITMTDSTFTAQYDPAVYPLIELIINRPQVITEHFPDGSSICYFGVLKSFIPGELAEGTVPEATCTIVPTNQDPTTCAEEGPVWTPGSGTASSC